MTQVVLNISDKSILPGLKKILSRVNGVDKVSVVSSSEKPQTKRQKFISEFTAAVKKAKDFKEGKTDFNTWEDLMNEL